MELPLAPTSPMAASRARVRRDLSHIPGDRGWPLIGHTLQALRDPQGFIAARADRFGPIYRRHMFGEEGVTLLGPEANEFVLLDTGRCFSSAAGWGNVLGRLFPGGLMLRDFDEHRLHRRALSVAFKAGAMAAYRTALDRGIAATLDAWRENPGTIRLYPAVKQLTLDLAASVFLGDDEEAGRKEDIARLQRAFIDMVAASIAPIRAPLPGTQMARGVRGRKEVVAYFTARVAKHRAGTGEDLFSQLCRATHEDGSLLAVEDVVNHMSFFMMAAHDTLTSSLSSLVYFLALHPEWQARLGAEAGMGDTLDGARIEAMVETEMAFKEALRLHPPVPSLVRRTVRETSFRGMAIPPGTPVSIDPLYTHHMPDLWPEPARFDPLRFTQALSGARHRFAFVPYGGGAHMCLGLHFAYLQAKCFAWHFLRRFRVSLPDGYHPRWRMWPIPKPEDGLLIRLTPL